MVETDGGLCSSPYRASFFPRHILKSLHVETLTRPGRPRSPPGHEHVPEGRYVCCGSWKPTAHADDGNRLDGTVSRGIGRDTEAAAAAAMFTQERPGRRDGRWRGAVAFVGDAAVARRGRSPCFLEHVYVCLRQAYFSHAAQIENQRVARRRGDLSPQVQMAP